MPSEFAGAPLAQVQLRVTGAALELVIKSSSPADQTGGSRGGFLPSALVCGVASSRERIRDSTAYRN
jgi:hypothetical protein